MHITLKDYNSFTQKMLKTVLYMSVDAICTNLHQPRFCHLEHARANARKATKWRRRVVDKAGLGFKLDLLLAKEQMHLKSEQIHCSRRPRGRASDQPHHMQYS